MDGIKAAEAAAEIRAGLTELARHYDWLSTFAATHPALMEPLAILADRLREARDEFRASTAILPHQPRLPHMESV